MPAVACAVMFAATCPVPVRAQEAASPATTTRFGLVHVDNMDLHLRRRPDAAPEVVEHLPAGDIADRYRLAAASGAGWHRWSLYWDLIDRGGTFEWAVPDAIVARDNAHGLRTLGVLQGNPPGVARVDGAPEGIDRPIFVRADGALGDDPAGATGINPDNTWARFVAAVVEHYRPGGTLARARAWPAGTGVRAWEIGNEPNLPFFWPGTAADYARFLEVAYLAAKWRDPSATVIHAGIANDAGAETWFAAFLDALKARAAVSPLVAASGYYFDKTAWHWYTVPSNLTVATPDRVRAMLAERGIPPKGLWVTEFGAPLWSEYPGPCWDPASSLRVSVAEQAAFVWQAAGEGVAAGAEVMVWFQLYDDCGNGRESYDAFGLVRNHEANQCWTPPNRSCWRFDAALAGMPRPAYDAYRTLAREVGPATTVIGRSGGAGWRSVILARPPAARVSIAWNVAAGDRTVALPAVSSRARLFELDGAGVVRSRTLTPAASAYTVRLPGVTNRNGQAGAPLTDGAPVVLVEDAVPPAALAAAVGGSQAPAPIPPDAAPPYLALVRALPAESPSLFEVSMVAGDAGSGLGAYQVYFAIGRPPASAASWTPLGTPLLWAGGPAIGEVRVPFVGAPGTTVYFAARAADRAGNWSALPAQPQAVTHIGASPSAAAPGRAVPSTRARPAVRPTAPAR
jgi:hypothetical protein